LTLIWYVHDYAEINSAPRNDNSDGRVYYPWQSKRTYFGADIMASDSDKQVKIRFAYRILMAPYVKLFLIDPETDTLIWLFDGPGFRKTMDTKIVIDPYGNEQVQYEVVLKKYSRGTTLTLLAQDADTIEYDILSNAGDFYNDFLTKVYTGQNRKDVDPFISGVKYSAIELQYKWIEIGRINDSLVEIGFSPSQNLSGTQDLMIHVDNVLLEGVEIHKIPRPKSIVVDSGSNNYSIELFCPAVSDTMITVDDSVHYRDTTFYSISPEDINIYYTLDGTNPYESGTKKEYIGTITVDGPVTIKAYAQYSDDSLWLPSRLYTAKYGDATSGTRNYLVSRQKPRIRDFNSVQSFRIDGRSLGRIAADRLGKGGKRLPFGIVIYREPGTRSCYPVLISR
jgi:hypothetical protein